MKSHLISLEYVRMAIQRSGQLTTTKAVAVSRQHPPMPGRGTYMLHGACVIVPLV